MRIDLVLPLLAQDLGRVQVLLAGLRKFWRVPGRLRVVVRDDELGAIERNCSLSMMLPQVIPESRLIGDLNRPGISGWRKQQLIKLAAADLVETDFYLTLDADCFPVQEVTYETLVQGGRGRYEHNSRTDLCQSWYDESARILGKPAPEETVSVTPFLLSRDLVLRCRKQLGDGWIDRLLTSNYWSEYTLYHIANADIWEAFYFKDKTDIMGNCVWSTDQASTWDPAWSFTSMRFLFSIIQSNTELPASWVADRVMPYLR